MLFGYNISRIVNENWEGTELNEKDKRMRDRANSLVNEITAIAITLGIVDIDISSLGANPSFASLQAILPDFTAFFISFLALSNIWTNHTQFYARVNYFKSWVMRENIILLLFISVFPKLTEFIIKHPSNTPVKIAYIVVYFVMTFIELFTMARVFKAYKKACGSFNSSADLDLFSLENDKKPSGKYTEIDFKKAKIEIIADISAGIINFIAVVISIFSIFVQPLTCYVVFIVNIFLNSFIKHKIKHTILKKN